MTAVFQNSLRRTFRIKKWDKKKLIQNVIGKAFGKQLLKMFDTRKHAINRIFIEFVFDKRSCAEVSQDLVQRRMSILGMFDHRNLLLESL
jgi:hypothetical protein